MVKPMIKVIYCNYGFKNPRKMFVCLFFLLNYYRDKCCCCLKDGKYTERINSRIDQIVCSTQMTSGGAEIIWSAWRF